MSGVELRRGRVTMPAPEGAATAGRLETSSLLRLTQWSLSLTAAALPLYVVRWHYGPLPTTLLENLVVLTVGLYIVTVAFHQGPLPGWTRFEVPIGLLMLAGVIGVFVAPDHRGAAGIFRAYLLEPVAAYYVAVAVLRDERAILRLAAAWAAGVCLFALVDLAYFTRALATHHLVPGHAAAAFDIDPNSVALFLEPLIALAAGFALLDHGRRRAIAGAVLALLLVAEVATLSRGGLLAMVGLGLVAILSVRSPRVRFAMIAAVAGAEVLVLKLPVLGARVADALNPTTGTFSIRTEIWAVTLQMLRHRPFFGAGINAYQSTMASYRAGNKYLVPEPYPHNIFLTSWTELGVMGMLAFSFILFLLVVLPWRALNRANGIYRPLLWGLGAAFAVIAIHGLFDSPYWKNDLSVEFWILAALEVVALRAMITGTGSHRAPA